MSKRSPARHNATSLHELGPGEAKLVMQDAAAYADPRYLATSLHHLGPGEANLVVQDAAAAGTASAMVADDLSDWDVIRRHAKALKELEKEYAPAGRRRWWHRNKRGSDLGRGSRKSRRKRSKSRKSKHHRARKSKRKKPFRRRRSSKR